VCSETLAFKLQTLVNYPEESIRHSEHGKSLKSRLVVVCEGLIIGDGSVLVWIHTRLDFDSARIADAKGS
jgi:hypothetical protein